VTTPPLAVATVLAWGLARRVPSPRQRVIAGTLTGLLAINVGEQMVRPWFAANVVVWLAWYVVMAWGVTVVLGDGRRDQSAKAAANEEACCVDGSPSGGETGGNGDRHQENGDRIHFGHASIMLTAARYASAALRVALVLAGLFVASTLAVHIERTMALERGAFRASLLVQLLAAGLFVSRWKRPDDAQIVALVLAGSTLGDVAGAWWYSDPVRDWGVGQIQALITWAAVAAWEGRCLIRARR
jgi:xanthosine utilization system XapX-like protein